MSNGIGAGIFDQEWLTAVLGGLGLIVVLSLILERALAVIFEWGVWDVWLAKTSLRAPLALLASYVICATLKFDILIVISKKDPATFAVLSIGTFVTAATIAGGSKGAITLFQNVLGFARGGNPEAVDKA
jgi:uncharacterized BrkB/YihY/UPF0761 family membrane protein